MRDYDRESYSLEQRANRSVWVLIAMMFLILSAGIYVGLSRIGKSIADSMRMIAVCDYVTNNKAGELSERNASPAAKMFVCDDGVYIVDPERGDQHGR